MSPSQPCRLEVKDLDGVCSSFMKTHSKSNEKFSQEIETDMHGTVLLCAAVGSMHV